MPCLILRYLVKKCSLQTFNKFFVMTSGCIDIDPINIWEIQVSYQTYGIKFAEIFSLILVKLIFGNSSLISEIWDEIC